MRLVLLFFWLAADSCLTSLAAEPVRAVAYHPKGAILAVARGGRVQILDSSGKELTVLEQIPGRVTAVSFSPSGRQLAVAAGEPGESGLIDLYVVTAEGLPQKRHARITKAHTDTIYALVYHPNSQFLASAGYDHHIHLWDINTAEPTRLRTLKDHSDTVYALAFHPQGHLLASASADRTVKVWNVDDARRLYTLSEPTDWLYALDWSPNGRFLAAGGVDRTIYLWQVNAQEGKLARTSFAHERAILRLAFGPDSKTLYSLGEDRVIKSSTIPELKEQQIFPTQPESVLAFAIHPKRTQLVIGRHDGMAEIWDLSGKQLATLPMPSKPPRFATIPETQGSTDSLRRAMTITPPITVLGAIDRPGDIDYFRFSALAGDEIGIEVINATPNGKLEPILTLADDSGRVLTEGSSILGYKAPQTGTYVLSLRDRNYRGGADFSYRLSIGPIPIVTGVFPLGLTRGETSKVQLVGVNLGKNDQVQVSVPGDAAPGSRISLKLPQINGEIPLGQASIEVGEFPRYTPSSESLRLPRLPATLDGVLSQPKAAQIVRFDAKKGQRVVVEVSARRLGSPLDSWIEILDSFGRPVPRAVLRSTAKTYTTLRDHTAESPGIRLESWNDFGLNDYLYADGELMRIFELPKGPDADCIFYSINGRRTAFLGTTPTYHPYGTPVYRVEVHPPGSTFAPNGMPITTLYYRNDDGGPEFGADSKLIFDPPSDGEYQVRLRDSHGSGGPNYGYRLTIRPPKPDFRVRVSPSLPEIWKGGGVPLTITADRDDEFDGPIHVEFVGLPPGIHAPPTVIEGNLRTTQVALHHSPGIDLPSPLPPLTVLARAKIGVQEVQRTFTTQPIKLAADGGEISARVREPEIAIHPGQQTRFTVDVERRGGFKGRIPISVQGLPFGVRVENVGLNGVLITERETSREVTLYAEPWVERQTRPLVIFARREGKNSEHAAPTVWLKVNGDEGRR